jgi:2,4-dichlorophenol 6-monooxygenase
MIETDVLIIGSGPAGSASALALSTYGVPNVLVTKYRWLANTPRAHITNQRTFEVLRDLGVEAEAKALAVPQDWMGNTVFCTALAGEELGPHPHLGHAPVRARGLPPCQPLRNGRPAADPAGADPARQRGGARARGCASTPSTCPSPRTRTG